jgi:hypothetical protein
VLSGWGLGYKGRDVEVQCGLENLRGCKDMVSHVPLRPVWPNTACQMNIAAAGCATGVLAGRKQGLKGMVSDE